MNEFDFLIELHKENNRQGPGSVETTQKAIDLIDKKDFKKIADIGCGTGGQTITLALNYKGKITAVDIFPEFLSKLEERANKKNLLDQIILLQCSMDNLPFKKNEFDLIWSEGAIYTMGYEKGIQYWQEFLKPGGYLAISEITWITNNRPKELEKYWQEQYAEIDTISNKIKVLEKHKFSPIAHFILPGKDWVENYYLPLQSRHEKFLAKYKDYPLAKEIIKAEIEEFRFYKKYREYYSYGFFIAQKNMEHNKSL